MSDKLARYSQIEEELLENLEEVAYPVKISFFVSTNNLLLFDCILSSNPHFHIGEKKSLYELEALFRALCVGEKVINEKMTLDIFPESADTICKILEWNDYLKRVVLIDVSNVSKFNEKKFIDMTTGSSDLLNDYFKKAYQEYGTLGEIK